MDDSMTRGGFSPYEQVKIGYMQSKKASGTAIAGLVTGVAGVVVAVAAGAWAGSRANNAKDVAIAKNEGLKDLVSTLAGTLVAERNERIAGDLNITTTINDTVSGQQSGQLSQSQQLSNEIALGVMTGEYERRPQRVALYRDQQACDCPCSCGCNG